ncbi:MAG: ABC transporter substrate-binding protein [Xanthobacteraceae bacterium]
MAIALLASAAFFTPSELSAKSLVIAGSGGIAQDAIDKAYDEPFTKDTGITIEAVEPWGLAKLRAIVESGRAEWDATELDGPALILATKAGYLEPIDWSVADPKNILPAVAKRPFAFVPSVYSTVMAYRTDKFPKAPSSWVDFWDVAKFPGGRALQNTPQLNLEFALIADGVPKADVYKVLATPEGIDRAFAKLTKLKPSIVKWWSAGAEPPQMLSSGEVAMSTAWNGRITNMKKEGRPVAIIWNGSAMNLTYFSIVKGTKSKREVEQYFASYLSPARAAAYAKLVPYPGFVPDIEKHLDASILVDLPTAPANVAQQFEMNDDFWAAHLPALTERWNGWLLE